MIYLLINAAAVVVRTRGIFILEWVVATSVRKKTYYLYQCENPVNKHVIEFQEMAKIQIVVLFYYSFEPFSLGPLRNIFDVIFIVCSVSQIGLVHLVKRCLLQAECLIRICSKCSECRVV